MVTLSYGPYESVTGAGDTIVSLVRFADPFSAFSFATM